MQSEVHQLPPPGATCALCHAQEAPGAHMDQAKALRMSGLSNRGLGPLMPVSMRPEPAPARSDQHMGSALPVSAAPAAHVDGAAAVHAAPGADKPALDGANPAAAAAPVETTEEQNPGRRPGDDTPTSTAVGNEKTPAIATALASSSQGAVVWVHRQCALWSPEVYPDKTGVLVSCWHVQRLLKGLCGGCGGQQVASLCSQLQALCQCRHVALPTLDTTRHPLTSRMSCSKKHTTWH